MAKITAIHGGGDWSDATANYLVLPEGIDAEKEVEKRRKWYHEEYVPALKRKENPKYIDMMEWLKNLGAREPMKEELEIVEDF